MADRQGKMGGETKYTQQHLSALCLNLKGHSFLALLLITQRTHRDRRTGMRTTDVINQLHSKTTWMKMVLEMANPQIATCLADETPILGLKRDQHTPPEDEPVRCQDGENHSKAPMGLI